MQTEEGMVSVGPAKLVRSMILQTFDWYLPESQHPRFLKLGEDYSYLNAQRWEPIYQIAKIRLAASLKILNEWSDRTETDDLMASWDDEVFFFYVLRFQSIWVNIYTFRDEELIPAGMDDFWKWAMTMRESESWLEYTFPTVASYQKLVNKPRIWKFFAPCDVAIS